MFNLRKQFVGMIYYSVHLFNRLKINQKSIENNLKSLLSDCEVGSVQGLHPHDFLGSVSVLFHTTLPTNNNRYAVIIFISYHIIT